MLTSYQPERARALKVASSPREVPTLLGNDEWRTAVLSHLFPPTRQFFTDRFPRLSDEAITPVTNMVDRLRVSRPVAAQSPRPLRPRHRR